ncbi:unnamed protein product [Choristocarpus tenellus]
MSECIVICSGTLDRNIFMDLVFHAGELADARSAPYRDQCLLLDITFAELQAASHLPHSSTSNSVVGVAAEERKYTHYKGSLDPHTYNLNTLAVGNFECLSKQAEGFLDELATHKLGGRGTGGYGREGAIKSRL